MSLNTFGVIYLLLIAPFLASFARVVVDRLPVMLEAESLGESSAVTLMSPCSCCDSCGHELTFFELIPVFSWIQLKGQCRACGAPIPVSHVICEGGAVGLAACALLVSGGSPLLAAGWFVFALLLLTAAWIDWRHCIAPDELTLSGLWLALALGAFNAGPLSIADSVIGALAGYGIFWLLDFTYRIRHAGQIGIGMGDAKLLAAMGAWMGVMSIPYIVLIASLVAAVYGMVFRIRGEIHFPFAPALVAGCFIYEVCHVAM